MKLKFAKPKISEYSFLRLYASTIIIQNQIPIIHNHQLEKELYKFYNEPSYHFLFEDIIKKEDKINPKNNHIDLSTAFQTAYALGLLTMIQDHSDLKSIINFSQKDALEVISQFETNQTDAMEKLCTEITESKKSNKKKILTK